jgi:flagellar basal-body rod modification protein FlgD
MSSVDTVSNFYSSLTSNTTSSSDSSTTGSGISLDSVDYLSLFLTQLQNQDPLDPMDTKDMSSQLCQYSQLEATQETNEYLLQQIQYLQAIGNTQAIGLIGKTVAVEGNEIGKSGDEISGLMINSESDLASATVTVYDADGNKVKSWTETNLSAGRTELTWDGTNDAGQEVADGTYTYQVTAADSDGASVDVTAYTTHEVTASTFLDGTNKLVMADGLEIPFANVGMVWSS